MTSTFNSSNKSELLKDLLSGSEKLCFTQGENICRPDRFPEKIFYVKSGTIRILTMSMEGKGPITLQKFTTGNWIGFTNLLFGKPCEWATAADDEVELLTIDAKNAASKISNDNILFEELLAQLHPSMIAEAMKAWM